VATAVEFCRAEAPIEAMLTIARKEASRPNASTPRLRPVTTWNADVDRIPSPARPPTVASGTACRRR
jgi:hypothetical protein